jgi:hypothetical protein
MATHALDMIMDLAVPAAAQVVISDSMAIDWTAVSPWLTDHGNTPFVMFFIVNIKEAKFLVKFEYCCASNETRHEIRVDLFEDFEFPTTEKIVYFAAADAVRMPGEEDKIRKEMESFVKHSGEISTTRRVMDALTPQTPVMTGIGVSYGIHSRSNKPFLWSMDVEVNDKFIARKPTDITQMIPLARCVTKATIEMINHKKEIANETSGVFRRWTMDAATVIDILQSAHMQVVVKYGKLME